MAERPETVFRFTAEGVDLEFAGTEAFVEKQVERFRAFLEGAIGQAAPAPDAADGDGASAPGTRATLEEFYAAHPTREGRGAIQDRILLFVYYLQHVQGRPALTKEDISWCFQQVGLAVPKNLLNALGTMKRKLGLLETSGRRGLYGLSPKGRAYVETHFRA